MDKPTVTYYRVGQVERWSPSRQCYIWREGWSTSPDIMPWRTRAEARRDEAARGCRAVFCDNDPADLD